MIIPVITPVIPEWIKRSAKEEGLTLQRSFHLTVVTYQVQQQYPEVVQELSTIIDSLIYIPINKYALVQKTYTFSGETRKTIIQRCQCQQLEEWYKEREIPYFPHITLFSNNGIGIGIDAPNRNGVNVTWI